MNERWLKLLERFLPSTASDAERAALRANPEKYQEYLNTLDQAYGPKDQRSSDMGFDPRTWYHGSFNDINAMDPKSNGTTPYLGKGTYLTTSPQDAANYSDLSSEDNQYKLQNMMDRFQKDYGMNYSQAHDAAVQKLTGGLDSGAVYPLQFRTGKAQPITVEDPLSFEDARSLVKNRDIALMQPEMKWPQMPDVGPDDWHARIKDPSKIRSVNAAFDPRFKNSADLLAGTAGAALVGGAALSGDDSEASPLSKARVIADEYAKLKGLAPIIHSAPTAAVDVNRARKIAEAFEALQHNPNDPAVRQAYDALVNETADQMSLLKDSGLKTDKILPGADNPYKNSKEMIGDVTDNNHLYYFPTEQGFGTQTNIADHPLLQNVSVGNEQMPANDAFRIIHDYFGHAKEGAGFGPKGEENAWREHMKMFSPEAQKALTTETRGQNSWVNFGPNGEANRANPANTVYADQKAGILPDWAQSPDDSTLKKLAGVAAVSRAPSLNDISPLNGIQQGIDLYKQNIEQPVANFSDKVGRSLVDTVTPPIPQKQEVVDEASPLVGAVVDPTNYIPFLPEASISADAFSKLKSMLGQ